MKKKWLCTLIIILITITTTSCKDTPSQINNEKNNSLKNVKKEFITPDKKTVQVSNAKTSLPNPFMPSQLSIPAIGVTAAIEPVHLLPNGQMDVPKDTNLAGILYPGILPGAKGNVIIDGHVDSYVGPAIFFKLKRLKAGDLISVSNQNGRKLTYTVESVEVFATAEAPLERIFGKSTEPRMNLITCTGRYSRKKKEHENRLVVFTKLNNEIKVP